MRTRRLVAATLACTLTAPAAATPVRMFAVGNEVRLADTVTYQAYHDKMAALMDASLPGRASLVQAGVDDVASHLAPADPLAPPQALVVFPEDVGLLAAFIGTRGATARTQTSSVGAIVSVLGTYAGPFAYYNAKYPGQPGIRNLTLALTDTLYRSFYETFRDLAVQHGVYLAAAANLAPARRVEEASEPALVAQLRDPDEPGRTYAYEAVSSQPHNTTFVFAPDGTVLIPDGDGGTRRAPAETGGVLSGSTDKAYLVQIEQPPPAEATGLALANGPVRNLEVLDTPVGRLAIVISKDAWMIDVNDRFLAKGANVIVQPEAFSAWAYDTAEWQPDVFMEGGFANLQKNPDWAANVDASMTGNLFDITFDGQSAIIGRRQKASPGPLTATNAWIGQNAETAFRALAPWTTDDPGIANPALTLAQRRAQLAAQGAPLLPGSGVPCGGALVVGACENGYREAVVWADVDVPAGAVTAAVDPVRALPPRFTAAVRVSGAESTPIAQHAPRVAASGRRVYVVWHEAATGLDAVRLAVSRDGGQTFGTPIRVSDNPPGTVAELHPAIAVRGGTVWVVWQEFANGRNDDDGRIMLARFDATGRKRGGDVRVDDAAGAGTWLPAVAAVGSSPVVVWIDERDAGPEGEPLEHVYAARGHAGGRRFDPAVRVDAGTPTPYALHNDNKWAPTIAAAGKRVHVAWSDFRNYNWDVFTARSDDGGRSWGTNVRVDDFPAYERIHERPAIATDRAGTVHVVWTDLRAREPDTNIFTARSTDRGTTFGANHQVDDSRIGFDADTQRPTSQWHPGLALDHGRLFVAWQDDRLGNDDVFFTTSTDDGATFAASERVDDTGAGTSAQTRPSLAIGGRGAKRQCYVAWEDDRNGDRDVYLARRSCGS
ncbi:MAG: sialidase family protein [Candidatus Binatia bacterium]